MYGREVGPDGTVTGVEWVYALSLVGSHSLKVARFLSHSPYLGIQAVQEGIMLIIS